jgi:hypothetical protein
LILKTKTPTLVLICLLSGCLTPVEVITDKLGGQIIISGQISTLPDQSILQIDVTADKERLPFAISGADVTIYEDNIPVGQYLDDGTTAGKYVLDAFQARIGKSYHIVATLPDGRRYHSAPERMPEEAGSLSSYFEFAREAIIDGEGLLVNKDFLRIYLNANLPDQKKRYLQWIVEETYLIIPFSSSTSPFTSPPCYVIQPADPQVINILNTENLNTLNVTDKFLVKRLVDHTFLFKHYFSTYQSSLTAEAYDYWRKVNILVSGNGGIFDTPPAKVYGNVNRSDEDADDRPYGYFQAVNQSVHRIFTLKDDIPFPYNYQTCVDGSNPNVLPTRCIDCLTVRNSTLAKPLWF